MAKLIYAAITSLDGYVADADGNFDWAEPDEEVFTFVNDLERPIGTYLYGRRMYEVMVSWGQSCLIRAISFFDLLELSLSYGSWLRNYEKDWPAEKLRNKWPLRPRISGIRNVTESTSLPRLKA